MEGLGDRGWGRVLAGGILLVLAALAPSFATFFPASIAAVVLAVAVAFVCRPWGLPQLTDAAILTALLWVLLSIPVVGIWPVPALIALILTGFLAWRTRRWGTWRQWLRAGRITGSTWLLLVVIVALTVAGLLLWKQLEHGVLPPTYRQLAHSVPVWAAGLGGLLFLIINGAVEDSVWSGVLLSAAGRVMPNTAVVATAASFGLAHLHGVPGGFVGVILAGCWGIVLGMLRLRTGGMLATYIAHAIADATIMLMLLPAALHG